MSHRLRFIPGRLVQSIPVAFGVTLDIGVGAAACEGIFEVPHMAGHFAVLDLQVADRRLEFGVPVHQALVAVDEALAVQIDEHLQHGSAEALVHGEALVLPVARGTEAAQLA